MRVEHLDGLVDEAEPAVAARVVRGNLVTALENTALWHERDISHSAAERIIFPDASPKAKKLCREFSSARASPAESLTFSKK